MLAPFARRVCLAFPIAGREARARYLVTGRPVPATSREQSRARERFGIGAEQTLRARVRRLARRALDQPRRRSRPSPATPFASCTSPESATTGSLRDAVARGYDLREYLEPEDFADALAAADLAVSRAGGSVFEIAAHGVPAVLVPYPHAAGDHQSTNARWMADAGAAVVMPDGELTAARLARQVAELLGDRPTCGDGVCVARARAPRCRMRWRVSCSRPRADEPLATRAWEGRRLHFVGVGGAGMSAYARAAHALGASVSGSDSADGPYIGGSPTTACCRRASATPAGNVPDGAGVEVVYFSAAPAENVERRRRARARPARAPARRAARRADGAAAHDRRGGHARQDDDRRDSRCTLSAAGSTRAGCRRHGWRRAGEPALERG